MRFPACAAALAATVAITAAPAHAEELLAAKLSVDTAVNSSCITALRTSGGVTHRAVRVPDAGYLTARLNADGGDWDLAVFRDGDAEPVAGSAYRGAIEVAAGRVESGDRLTVQACRRSGRTTGATLTVDLEPGALAETTEPPSLVRVSTPTNESKNRLLEMAIDVTESGGPGYLDVFLHGSSDRNALRTAGFSHVEIADSTPSLSPGDAGALPSGRTKYRRLFEISSELAGIADESPEIVRPITMPLPSGEGRRIEGIEIATDPHARDGRPVFLVLGMHHAQEWPAAEMPLEWAHRLVDGFRAEDPRIVDLVRRVRTIVVPVVSPDGYNDSRESGHALGNDDGFGDAFGGTQNRRKNCRRPDDTHGCDSNLFNGVDPNRNYAGFWGGIGSDSVFEGGHYRGKNPFSEPETENVRRLVSSRQVVLLITNHTAGRLILRQPGVASRGPSVDEAEYKALGDAMAAENGYTNQFSKELYDHGGTTDAWSYWATGGFAYVFELVNGHGHPGYTQFVADYDGWTGGGGNREAYFKATEWAADPAGHSLLTGVAPAGAILRLTKSFLTTTQTPAIVPDRLDTVMQVPASGAFEWHVNPSTRPAAAEGGKKENWILTCEMPAGTVLKQQAVFVRRGDALRVTPCPFDAAQTGNRPVVPPPDEFAPPPP